MVNESFAQGLLQNLLAPQQQQQRMSPQDIMAAMSSPNPMAAVMAASVPQTTQAIGQGVRGMIGGITGQTPYSATEAYSKAMQQISQQPGFGTTSDSLTAMAQAANAVGRIPEAMQLMAQANERKKEEEAATQLQGQNRVGRDANIRAVRAARDSIDEARYPGLAQALDGLSSQYFAETTPSSPDKVQSTISNMFERAKVELPEPAKLTPEQLARLYESYTAESIRGYVDSNFTSPLIPLREGAEGLTAAQRANLYSLFTSESIDAHLADSTKPLIPLSAASAGKLTLAQQAPLYKDFTGESIDNFANGKGPLVPLPKEGAELSLMNLADLASKFTPESIREFKADPQNAMLVPLPKGQTTPSSVLEYNYAVEQGYEGTFEDWKQLGAARSTTVGAAPQGYYYTTNDKGELGMLPVPGGPADKGMNVSDAARAAMIKTATNSLNELRSIVYRQDEGGNFVIDRGLVFTANFPMGGFPWSEGRTVNVLIQDSLEAKIRLESGAAVPTSEIERLAERFRPSLLDNDATILRKMRLLESFFNSTTNYLRPDNTFDTDTALADINSALATGESLNDLSGKTDAELFQMLSGNQNVDN